MVVECVSAPEVPVTVTVALPVVAVPDAVSVRVEVVLPFAGGVTGFRRERRRHTAGQARGAERRC